MIRLFGQTYSPQEIRTAVGRMDQIAGIRSVTLRDALEEGTHLLEVYTGSGLSFDLVSSRALDLSAIRYRGIPLAWRGVNGDSHPAYYEPQGAGWLRSFAGGLLTTCGLDQFGAPAQDGPENLGLHGRIGQLPAHNLQRTTAWQGNTYLLEVRAEIRQARTFGENLLLRRTVRTQLGSNRIDLHDTVINEGFAPQEHLILYHCNLGFPLLSPEAYLEMDPAHTQPRDPIAAQGLSEIARSGPPTPGFEEQVFRHTPPSPGAPWPITLHNPSLGLALRLTVDTSTLPYLFQWKMLGQGTYVLGLEPANSGVIQGRPTARDRGDLPILQPGEARDYRLSFEVIDSGT